MEAPRLGKLKYTARARFNTTHHEIVDVSSFRKEQDTTPCVERIENLADREASFVWASDSIWHANHPINVKETCEEPVREPIGDGYESEASIDIRVDGYRADVNGRRYIGYRCDDDRRGHAHP